MTGEKIERDSGIRKWTRERRRDGEREGEREREREKASA